VKSGPEETIIKTDFFGMRIPSSDNLGELRRAVGRGKERRRREGREGDKKMGEGRKGRGKERK